MQLTHCPDMQHHKKSQNNSGLPSWQRDANESRLADDRGKFTLLSCHAVGWVAASVLTGAINTQPEAEHAQLSLQWLSLHRARGTSATGNGSTGTCQWHCRPSRCAPGGPP